MPPHLPAATGQSTPTGQSEQGSQSLPKLDAGVNGAEPAVDDRPDARWLRGTGATLPPVDPDSALDAVLDWKFVALGRRPEDYMGRDLLLATLVRDGRKGLFHRLTGEPESWVVERAAHLPGKKQPAAVQLTALDYLHRRQLGRLWAGLEEARQPGDFGHLQPGVDHGLLLSLNACRPFGADYEWAGPPRSRD